MGGMRHHVLCSQWKRPLSCLSKSQSLRWQTQKLISCSPCGRSKKLHADLHLSTQSGHLEITFHWIVRATALLWHFSSRCPPFSQSHTQLCLTPRSSCYHPWQPSTFSNFPSRLFSSISMIPYPTSWNHPSDLLQGYWMVMSRHCSGTGLFSRSGGRHSRPPDNVKVEREMNVRAWAGWERRSWEGAGGRIGVQSMSTSAGRQWHSGKTSVPSSRGRTCGSGSGELNGNWLLIKSFSPCWHLNPGFLITIWKTKTLLEALTPALNSNLNA